MTAMTKMAIHTSMTTIELTSPITPACSIACCPLANCNANDDNIIPARARKNPIEARIIAVALRAVLRELTCSCGKIFCSCSSSPATTSIYSCCASGSYLPLYAAPRSLPSCPSCLACCHRSGSCMRIVCSPSFDALYAFSFFLISTLITYVPAPSHVLALALAWKIGSKEERERPLSYVPKIGHLTDVTVATWQMYCTSHSFSTQKRPAAMDNAEGSGCIAPPTPSLLNLYGLAAPSRR